MIGGPGRDRTDDLFHAMEAVKPQVIDGTVLTNRQNRQKRPNRRYLRAKCGQNQPSGQWAGRVEPAREFQEISSRGSRFSRSLQETHCMLISTVSSLQKAARPAKRERVAGQRIGRTQAETGEIGRQDVAGSRAFLSSS